LLKLIFPPYSGLEKRGNLFLETDPAEHQIKRTSPGTKPIAPVPALKEGDSHSRHHAERNKISQCGKPPPRDKDEGKYPPEQNLP